MLHALTFTDLHEDLLKTMAKLIVDRGGLNTSDHSAVELALNKLLQHKMLDLNTEADAKNVDLASMSHNEIARLNKALGDSQLRVVNLETELKKLQKHFDEIYNDRKRLYEKLHGIPSQNEVNRAAILIKEAVLDVGQVTSWNAIALKVLTTIKVG